MEHDSLEDGRKEKMLIFVHGNFAEKLLQNLITKYNTILSNDISSTHKHNQVRIIIVNEVNQFKSLCIKCNIRLDRFFKINMYHYDENVYTLADKYFSIQRGLVEILNCYKSIDDVIRTFPPESIVIKEEYTDTELSIHTICYKDGKQVFDGLTRDYRGESFIHNKINNTYYLLRGNLPVSREYVTLDFLTDVSTLYVTPKYDGSMINITFIHEKSKVFEMIKNKPLLKYSVDNGIVFFGTRKLLISKDVVIVQRFERAVKTRVSNFINTLINTTKPQSNTVFHFELMTDEKLGNLSVSYNKPFCILFGFTSFDESRKKFYLPRGINFMSVDIKEFKSKVELQKYIDEEHDKMLNGDLTVEPEGFVIHTNNSICKLKFKEYFIAHKPTCHLKEAVELSNKLNGKTRFFKIQTPVEPKVNEICLLLKNMFFLSYNDRSIFIRNNMRVLSRIDQEVNQLRFNKKKNSILVDI